MNSHTKIEWVKNPNGSPGYTWNPITGCLNHDHGICRGGGFPCYAYQLAHGRLKHVYTIPSASRGVAVIENPRDPFYPRFWPGKLDDSFGERPKGIFVCDMGDLFGLGVPWDWTRQVMNKLYWNERHRFYLLTKQPQNLAQWSSFPPNCWVGVTVTRQKFLAPALHFLGKVKASVKFLSCEPLLEELSMTGVELERAGISWVIVGSQTKPSLPAERNWINGVLWAASGVGAAVFLKNSLQPLYPGQELRQEVKDTCPYTDCDCDPQKPDYCPRIRGCGHQHAPAWGESPPPSSGDRSELDERE